MKVSDRIKDIRANVNIISGCSTYHDRLSIAQQQLIQLEVEIAEALQAAKQEGYLTGYKDGYSGGYEDGYKVGRIAGYDDAMNAANNR